MSITTMIRWTPRRKAAIVEAINAKQMTISEASEAYSLSHEELAGRISNLQDGGLQNLRVTRNGALRGWHRE